MKLFDRRKKKSDNGEIELEYPKYDIELVCLSTIPHLNTQVLNLVTFDSSVTQLRIPPYEKEVEENGDIKKVQYPEVIFNLVVPTKSDEVHEREGIDLERAKLPGYHLIASKCVVLEDQCNKKEMNGGWFYTKLVYDLFIKTSDRILSTDMQYQEYRKDLETMRNRFLHREQEMEQEYKEWKQKMEESHIQKEQDYRNAITDLNKEIYDLTIAMPSNRNKELKESLKRMTTTK